MRCVFFLGLLLAMSAMAAEEMAPAKAKPTESISQPKKADQTEQTKRDADKDQVLIPGTPGTHNYILQSPDPQQQPAYQNGVQQDLYIPSYRKPQQSALPYSNQPLRRQYITLQQLQALQQAAAQQQQQQEVYLTQQQQVDQHKQQSTPGYETVQNLGRPAQVVYKTQQPQTQYAASAIVDTAQSSFEEELAQLVAANRAQEQKYHDGSDAVHHSSIAQPLQPATVAPAIRKPAPQQYLKEITRPTPRPIQPVRPSSTARTLHNRPVNRPVIYHQQIPVAHQEQIPLQYEQAAQPQAVQPDKQSPPLYRFVYQHEPHPQKAEVPVQTGQPDNLNKHYISAQEYYRQQGLSPLPNRGVAAPATAQHQLEDALIRQLLLVQPLNHPQHVGRTPASSPAPKTQPGLGKLHNSAQPARAPAGRPLIYVPQGASGYRRPATATGRAPYQPLPNADHAYQAQAQAEEDRQHTQRQYHHQQQQLTAYQQQQPAVASSPRFSTLPRDKPLTQAEFQNLLQQGGYTATLLPSNPNSPHQEYLLHPRYVPYQQGAQQGAIPDSQQHVQYVPQQLKRRPVSQFAPASA